MKTLSPSDDPDELLLGTPPPERPGLLRGRAGREIRRALIDTAVSPDESTAFAPGGIDRLALFTPMVTAVRVATTAISLLLAAPCLMGRCAPRGHGSPRVTRARSKASARLSMSASVV